MDTSDFRQCLERGEGISIEFKRCSNVPKQDTFESICAFANRQGGNVFLGVEDDGIVCGIKESLSLSIQRNIVNVLNDPSLFNAPPPVEIEEIYLDDKLVIRIWVPVSSIVHRYKDIAYDRIADSDIKVKTDLQMSSMYIRKQEYYSERRVYRYLKESDLRLDLLTRVRELAVAKRANHPWLQYDNEELLRSSNLYLKDYETGEEGFTLAAALLLGKDDVIASLAPAYKTDAYLRVDNTDRYDDRIVVRTNLIEAYDLLLGFMQKHLPDRFYVEHSASISLRDVIARELIVNMLIHREFTNPVPAKLVIDRLGIHAENASRPRFVGPLSPEKFNPLPKNPIIAEFFSNIGRAETLGSGTRNIFKYSWIYGGGEPSLYDDDIFKADIPLSEQQGNSPVPSRDVDEVIHHMLEVDGYFTVNGVADIANVTVRTVRRHVAPLVSDGKIVAEGSTRDRRYVKAK